MKWCKPIYHQYKINLASGDAWTDGYFKVQDNFLQPPSCPLVASGQDKGSCSCKREVSSLSSTLQPSYMVSCCLVGKRTQSRASTAQVGPCWTEFFQTQPGDHRSLQSHFNKWLRIHCNMRVKESERVLILFLSGNITEVYASGIGGVRGGANRNQTTPKPTLFLKS